MLAHAPGLREVGEDAVHPCTQRRAFFELVDLGQDRDPGLLDDLRGHVVACDVRARDPQHAGVMALYQLGERRLLSGAQTGDQLRLLGVRRMRLMSAARTEVWESHRRMV